MKKALLTGAAVLAASAIASPLQGQVPAGFKSRADAYLKQAYRAEGPGAAAIVVDDGKVVYSGAQGRANIESGTPLTPDTVFRLGSITKQFTAAVILQLVEEGKLSLSDPLSKFLPDFPKPGADATIAQLLNHTSGIKSYTGIPGFMANDANTSRAYTTEQLIAEFRGQPADFPVGSRHLYNNSGYVLLGAIIEKVTGKPWHVAVDERIAKPFGLASLRYGELEAGTPNMASGYSEQDGKQVPARKLHMSVPHAAGALIASTGDLAKWALALHKGKVLKSPTYASMIAPSRLPDGTALDYAFGLKNVKVRGRPSLSHGGGIFGFDTASMYIPGEDVFVAVFANSNDPAVDPDVVMTQLAALAVGDPLPQFSKAKVSRADIEPLLGMYRMEDAERRFFARDGRLFTRRTGGADQEVFAAGKDRFFYGPTALSWFEVRRKHAGKHVMAMYADGEKEPTLAVRSGPVPAEAPEAAIPPDVLERYVGSYKASRGMAKVAMGEDGRLTLQLGPQRPVPIVATSATEFRAEGVDAKVVFHTGGAGVSHLIIHQGGNELRADRVAEGS